MTAYISTNLYNPRYQLKVKLLIYQKRRQSFDSFEDGERRDQDSHQVGELLSQNLPAILHLLHLGCPPDLLLHDALLLHLPHFLEKELLIPLTLFRLLGHKLVVDDRHLVDNCLESFPQYYLADDLGVLGDEALDHLDFCVELSSGVVPESLLSLDLVVFEL